MPVRPAAQLVAALAQALLGVPLPLGLRCWDGSEVAGPPGSPTLVVRSPKALRRIVYAADELGLARAYVSGDLDIEGDLYATLQFPDALPARPEMKLDRTALAPLLRDLVRTGVLGWPVRPPAEESRLRGLRHSLRRDSAAISHHYDVGNEFYALLLGPSLVYSCAYYETPGSTLEQAQAGKLDLVCRKLALQPGMRLLDVGCGWGSLVLHAAATYGVQAVGVTISPEQAELARRRVADAGPGGPGRDPAAGLPRGRRRPVRRHRLGRHGRARRPRELARLRRGTARAARPRWPAAQPRHRPRAGRRPRRGRRLPLVPHALRVPRRGAAAAGRPRRLPRGRRVRGAGRRDAAGALRPDLPRVGAQPRGALGGGAAGRVAGSRAGVAALPGGLRAGASRAAGWGSTRSWRRRPMPLVPVPGRSRRPAWSAADR